jgi:nucleotide-binding universal stress UspA family protein
MAARVGTNGPNTARADGPNVRGMSTSIERPGLIVGIDGSAASKAAVDWAARDASMRSVSLTLVHVASGLAGTWPTPPPIGFGEWQQQRGRRIIDEAVSIVEETNTGGMTCHAAIVARELGVPCVVGTRTATRDLHDGTTVTVDGTHGQVASGRVEASPRCRWLTGAHLPNRRPK